MDCLNCNTADQNGEFCTYCGASMTVKPSTLQVAEIPVSSPIPLGASATSVDSHSNLPEEDHVDVAMEVFADKVKQIQEGSVTPQSTAATKSQTSGQTSVTAVAALISVFFIPLLGLILGYLAKREIVSSSGAKLGRGLAQAAIVLGWIFVGFGTMIVLLGVLASAAQQ